MELKEVTFSDLSQVECKLLLGEAKNRRSILVVRFIGEYREGSLGNPDVAFMNAMVSAGLTAWEPSAAVIDLSGLKYVWGDMLEVVLPDDAGEIGDARIPAALVVGDGCREAVRTLIFGENSSESLSEVDWVHGGLKEALSYVSWRLGAA